LAEARAIDLAYAERKFLSMARILAARAEIWLLDEPASGLDLASRLRFGALLKEARRQGVAICLIEHNLDVVTELAGGGADTVSSALNLTLMAQVEGLALTGAATLGTGNGLANRISAGAGAQLLAGLDGGQADGRSLRFRGTVAVRS
jgi:hypothetical protein